VSTAAQAPYNNQSSFKSANLNLRRRFNLLPFPTALQVGGRQNIQTVDARQQSLTFSHTGPGGNNSPVPYLMQSYRHQDSHYGFRDVPWTSVNRAYNARHLFVQTAAQAVSAETSRITGSEHIQETVSALSGAIVVIINNIMGLDPNPEFAAAMVTILTICGHRWTDR